MSAGGASTSAAFFPLSRKLPRFQVGGGAARIAVLVRRRWIRAGGFESRLGSSWWNWLSLTYGTNCQQLSILAEDSRVVKSLCQLCRSPVYHWILANNANPALANDILPPKKHTNITCAWSQLFIQFNKDQIYYVNLGPSGPSLWTGDK